MDPRMGMMGIDPWLSGCKQPFTDRVVFCSATEASVVYRFYKASERGVASYDIHPRLPLISL